MGNTTAVQSGAQQLVRVFKGLIGGVQVHAVDGRDLHAFLKSGWQFSDWIKKRIEQYGFEENQDFALISVSAEIKKGRGGDRRSVDYHLTLDMAKELSMVENNDQGRMARRYFIDMERKALAAPAALPAPDKFERIVHAFRGVRVEFLFDEKRVWVKASCVSTALSLGSSDRITRNLPDDRKLVQVRGLQRHLFIDPAAAMRASGYVHNIERAKAWEVWLAETLPSVGAAAQRSVLVERDLACLYALCEAGDRLLRAHQALAPVHQAMRSNALIGVPAALETLQVGVRHLRKQLGGSMQVAAEHSGLAECSSPNLLGIQLSDALGEKPLSAAELAARPVQGDLIPQGELSDVQKLTVEQVNGSRVLVSLQLNGLSVITPVGKDALIIPAGKLAEYVRDPAAIPLQDIPAVAQACTERMGRALQGRISA